MTRVSAPSFDIGRSRHRCAVGGGEFSPGMPIVVALFEDLDAEGVLHRLDFAPEAWERFRDGGAAVSAEVVGDGSGAGADGGAGGGADGGAAWAVPARVFAAWRSVAQEPGAKRRSLLDEGSMLELFESLEDSGDDAQRAFRFVLALVLIRKKLLVHAGAVPGSGDGDEGVLLVRAKGEPSDVPPIEVAQPALTPERIASVTARIDELLRAEGS
ncbi:MAG: hypothetical protein ACTS3F_06935 [Phycisphaerales bacterium]